MIKRIVSIMLVMCLLNLVACQNGASDSKLKVPVKSRQNKKHYCQETRVYTLMI